ncbi:hypothetical protein PMIN01_02806 [Paraphaeosphaeria minitans]|uniref:Uncharacterized protein n=1 Tax=Paraphaeosphaeria minitans TaxID=565426 RepID=A0A9P6KVL7_9PLEO|nr:hypothetical protein PMIN01_02806 [Paraphaeosphaeria minitans]
MQRSFDQPRAFLFLGYSSPAALRAGSLRSLLSQLTAIIQILRPPTFPSTGMFSPTTICSASTSMARSTQHVFFHASSPHCAFCSFISCFSRASSRSICFVVAVITLPPTPILIHHRLQSTANCPAFSKTSVSTCTSSSLVSRNLATRPCGVLRTEPSTRARRDAMRRGRHAPQQLSAFAMMARTCFALTSPTYKRCRRPPLGLLHRLPQPHLHPRLF